jgi:endonuclease/exonuclease/phosphatase family metal-dependent hydrolase
MHKQFCNFSTSFNMNDVPHDVLRVATYNIHKGVRGLGPAKRLEIHNLAEGIGGLNADLFFLQEVRNFHHGEARKFSHHQRGWPVQPQAQYLAPKNYQVAYRTNATTQGAEHGNALLSRWPLGDVGHHDVSDHRFEQRGLLHVPVHWRGQIVHTINLHLGLMHASRLRQVQRLGAFIDAHIPPDAPIIVAGDFNDWAQQLNTPMAVMGLQRAHCHLSRSQRTFPSRMPMFALDRIYSRGFEVQTVEVPRGPGWARMSDHLPLLANLILANRVAQ